MLFLPVVAIETDITRQLGEGSHLSWDHPYYDIARHQIVEVAGEPPAIDLYTGVNHSCFI